MSFLTGDLVTTIVAIITLIGGALGLRYKFKRDGAKEERQKAKDRADEIQQDMGVARDIARRDGAAKRLRDGDF